MCVGTLLLLILWTVIVPHVHIATVASTQILLGNPLILSGICRPIHHRRRLVCLRTDRGNRLVVQSCVGSLARPRSFGGTALSWDQGLGGNVLLNIVLWVIGRQARVELAGTLAVLLLGHHHHLRHVDLLVHDASRASKGAIRVHIVWREGVVDLSLVAADSWVGIWTLKVVGVTDGRVSGHSTDASHVVLSSTALTELVFEFKRYTAGCQALKMHIRYRLEGTPAWMLLLLLRCKASQGLLGCCLITVAKQSNSNLLPVVPGNLCSLRRLMNS